jgi:hypothetical protein
MKISPQRREGAKVRKEKHEKGFSNFVGSIILSDQDAEDHGLSIPLRPFAFSAPLR